MQTTFRYDLLLFCKERLPGKRLLYFVELDTLRADLPVLHCFSAGRALFDALTPGGLYRLETRKRRIVSAQSDGEFDVDESYYSMLLELKELRFDSPDDPRPFHPEQYYSFTEARALYEYREPAARRFGNGLLRLTATFFALALPPAAYVLFLVSALSKNTTFAAPFSALLLLFPALYAMTALYTLCDLLFLRWPRTRYGMLRAYALRHGGRRRSLCLSVQDKRRFAVFGGVSGGMILLAAALLIFL